VIGVVRFLVACATTLIVALGVPSVAFADAAGPTDYLSEILEIDPATPSIDVSVIGGDSFVQLVASSGTEVIVLGYRSEHYLWFQPDGTVLQNRNAPSTYTNDDRYGGGEIPTTATPEADPDWREVASNGQYSWHDHRAHWMQSSRPAGKGVGDQVVEGVIPLLVDGAEVDVTVISTWQPAASRVPAVFGALAAAGAVAAAVWRWRLKRSWTFAAMPLAVVAAIAGAWQYLSLPAETGPRLVWWLVPAVAAAAAFVAVVAELGQRSFIARAATLVTGVQLAVWGLIKRDGLTAALVPTGAPGWFDRLATSAALVGGVSLTAFAIWSLFAPEYRRDGSANLVSDSRERTG
jgi:hypothetical protein